MQNTPTLILALFLCPIGTFVSAEHARAGDNIVVAAKEATAVTTPRDAKLKLITISAIEFPLRAALRCKGDIQSVTLSIADTVRTLGNEDFEDQWSAETTLTVPASQIALAASSRFCIEDDPDSADELLVPGFATASASLRCESNRGVSMHFASTPLQLRLQCERGEPQVPSESSADR